MGLKWKLLIPLNAAVIAVMISTFYLQIRQVESNLLKQEQKRLAEEAAFLVRDVVPSKNEQEIIAVTSRFCMSMVNHQSPRHQVIVEHGHAVIARGMQGKPSDLEDSLLSAKAGTNVLPYRKGRIVVHMEQVVGQPEEPWTIRVADDLSDMDRQLSRFQWISGLSIAAVTLVLLVIVNILVHFLATRPAALLGRIISEIGRGNFNVVFPSEQTREFAIISDALNKMAQRLAEAESKELLEMKEAAEIQQHILPPASVEIPGMSLEYRYEPCEKIGGDYCDVLELKDGVRAIVVGDVSGHGVPAALTTTMLKVLLEHHLMAYGSLVNLMTEISLDLGRYIPQGKFVTLFCALYFPKTRILKHCSAGHPPPLLFRTSEPNPIQLATGGPALGIMPPEYLHYEEGEITLLKGDALVLFTDGLTERYDKEESQFGSVRLIEICRRGIVFPPKEAISLVLDEVKRFGSDTPQDDDITILVAKVI